MTDYPPFNNLNSQIRNRFIGILILVFLVFINFVSCTASSEPELLSSRGIVVFDYPQMDSYPSVKLGAFVETVSDVHRVEMFSIKSRKNNYQWYCYDPLIFGEDKRQWAGYTGFVCPAGDKIPNGFYDFIYEDAEGQQKTSSFSVNYDEELLSKKGTEAENFVKEYCREKIVIYSKQNTIIYYGDKKPSWKDDGAIFRNYNEASNFQRVYTLNGDSVMIVMPPVYKQ